MVRKTRIQESEVRSQKNRVGHSRSRIGRVAFWLVLFSLNPEPWILNPAFAQQPQAQSGQPAVAVNAKYVNGVAPGYWPTAGSGLTLNLSSGTAFCGTPPSKVTYAGGTLTMAASATNYVFLDPSAGCAPGSNATGFAIGHIPLAQIATSGTAITVITDMRTWSAPLPCAMSSAGAVTCASLGANILTMQSSSGVALGSGGTPITKHLSATASLSPAAPASVPGCSPDVTATLTGAAVGDTVALGTPAPWPAGMQATAFVSSGNTVAIRWCQFSGAPATPPSGTYRVDDWQH